MTKVAAQYLLWVDYRHSSSPPTNPKEQEDNHSNLRTSSLLTKTMPLGPP